MFVGTNIWTCHGSEFCFVVVGVVVVVIFDVSALVATFCNRLIEVGEVNDRIASPNV